MVRGDESIDYECLFERLATPYMILDPSLRILAVNDAAVAASMVTRAKLIGFDVFAAFPGGPAQSGDPGASPLRESLEAVLATRRSHAMGIVKYDLQTDDGIEERYWSPVNTPILDADGQVYLIIHRTDDVTDFVRGAEALLAQGDGGRPGDIHLRVVEHAHRVQEANRDLRLAKRQLERIAAQQAIVARLGQQAASGESLQDLVEQATSAVSGLPDVCGCEVVGWQDDGTGLSGRTGAGECADDEGSGIGGDTAASICRALGSDAAVLVADVAHAGGSGSAMAAAIGDLKQPFGVLIAHGASRGAFSAEDLSFLTTVANVLAGGLERTRHDAEMRRLALHDDLTGLPNRKLLLDRLGSALTRARRDGGVGALALLDLDGFKAINDTLGHHAGDAVLRHVATNLTGALRGGDTVARVGGDEFALVLPEVATEAEAGKVARKVLGAIRQRLQIDARQIGMDASIGLALYPLHGDDEGLLLRRADAAMYVAKRAGGGHAIYTAEHDDFDHRRRGEVADLRRAIDESELTLHYQPKLDLSDDSVCGLEALVRWSHPDRGLIAPGDFIPLAEESGLIRSLTLRVLTTALEQAGRWRREGIEAPVSVNLSADCLHDPALIPTLLRCLGRAGVPPAALELEVAESAFMRRPGAALTVIGELAAAGIRTSMDDFGTGQSSLAYLERLPLHELKIDKSFLLEPRPGDHRATMVDAVSGLAHTFDLTVVGEGIESREVCHALKLRGCDRGQGFHLQAPLPADAMTAWLRGRRFARADPATSSGAVSPSAGS